MRLDKDNVYFLPPNNKNGLSISPPSRFDLCDSFEFIVKVKPDLEKLKEEKFGGYVVSINGKHLGIQVKDVFIDGTLWTTTGEKKLTDMNKYIYPKYMHNTFKIHFICNLKEKYIKIKENKDLFKEQIIKFDGEMIEEYKTAYLWVGCGYGFSECPVEFRQYYTGDISYLEIKKDDKTIFLSNFKKKTDFKIFDESGCGNHLLKFNAKWY
jgi:hypothetical protein